MGTIVNQAAMILPPKDATKTTTSASSSAAVSLGSDVRYSYFTFCAQTERAYIKFGDSSMGAADTEDLPLPTDVYVTFYIPDTTYTHFRVIADGAGAVHWYKSG